MNEEFDLDEIAPWLVLLAAAVGAGLRMLMLGVRGLALDETVSLWMAGRGAGEMLSWVTRIDQNPPLYYALLRAWTGLNGSTPYDARLLSVLFGVLAIFVIYWAGRRLGGTLVGLAAAAILAFSPFHILLAQEARMFTLLAFNAAAAICALIYLLTSPESARPFGSQLRAYARAWGSPPPVEDKTAGEFTYRDDPSTRTGWRGWLARHTWLPLKQIEADLAWIAYVVFTAAALWSHNTALLFFVTANLVVIALMVWRRARPAGEGGALHAPSARNWLIAQGAVLLLWAAWLVPFIQQAGRVFARFWLPAPTAGTVIAALRAFLNASGPIPLLEAVVTGAIYAVVLGFGLASFRRAPSRLAFLAALFVLPILGALAASLLRPVFWDRTLIWVTFPLFLVLAAGVAKMKYRFLVFVALGSLLTINIFSIGDYYRFHFKEDWKTAARSVAGFAEKGDLVLFSSNLGVIPFDYYFIPYEEYYGIEVEKVGLPATLTESGAAEPAMTAADVEKLSALLREHGRVWLVYSHAEYTDPNGLVPKALEGQMKLARTFPYNGGVVLLYTRP